MPDPLGARLIRAGLITRDALDEALERRSGRSEGLAGALVEGGLDEEALLAHFSREGHRAVDEATLAEAPAPKLLARIPRAMAEVLLALPLAAAHTGALVAMADPSDADSVEQLSLRLGCPVLPRVARVSALREAIARAFAGQAPAPAPAAHAPPRPRRPFAPAPVPFALPAPHDLDSRWDEAASPLAAAPPIARRPNPPPPRRPRGKLAPRRPAPDALAAPGDLGASLAALRSATSRDAILRAACEGILPVCEGAIFLGRRREMLVGHECAGRYVSRDAIRSLFLPLSVPSSLRRAVESQRPYHGVYGASDADRLFRASIGSRSLSVSIEPVLVSGRVTGLLCADDPRYGEAGAERMALVAHATGAALARLILARRD